MFRTTRVVEEATPVLREAIAAPGSRDAYNSAFTKSFPGGRLVMTGANSAAALRSTPARYLALIGAIMCQKLTREPVMRETVFAQVMNLGRSASGSPSNSQITERGSFRAYLSTRSAGLPSANSSPASLSAIAKMRAPFQGQRGGEKLRRRSPATACGPAVFMLFASVRLFFSTRPRA